ncbi:MAG TPA: hypothetical protein VK137_01445, partial [Planctomycetaceae bacterium]|nr:hypothetical protein [Planctomycetaceae bacterium]
LTVQKSLIQHREEILERQLVQEPIAEAAMELFASCCVLTRLDADHGAGLQPAANLFLQQSARRVREALLRLRDNDNATIEETAKSVL